MKGTIELSEENIKSYLYDPSRKEFLNIVQKKMQTIKRNADDVHFVNIYAAS